jgi:hypothetical protein
VTVVAPKTPTAAAVDALMQAAAPGVLAEGGAEITDPRAKRMAEIAANLAPNKRK